MLSSGLFINYICLFVLSVLASVAYSDSVLTLSDDALLLHVDELVISGAVEDNDEHLELRALNRIMRRERTRFGNRMSVDELHQIADKLTLYVRERGYLFHTVYLPPQRVRNNIVQFSFQSARLTDVNVISSDNLEEVALEKYFERFLHKSLYAPEIEKQVLALKAQHGVNIFAFYSRGAGANEIRLNLKAKRTRSNAFSFKAENYGTATTGRNRVIADASFSGIATSFDTFALAALKTAGSGDTLYGFINYSYPFKNLRTVLNLDIGDTSYSLGSDFNALEMSGDSRTYRIALDQNIYLNTLNFQKVFLSAFRKESRLHSEFDESLETRETSEGLSLGWGGNRLFSDMGAVLGYSFEISQGSLYEGGNDSVSRDLLKLSYSTQLSKKIFSESRYALGMYVNVRGQHSGDPLPGIESMSLSGIYGVRAIEAGTRSSDIGWIASLDVRLPQLIHLGYHKPLSIVPGVFFDIARGETLYDETEYNTETRVSGWGVGMDMAWRKTSAKLAWATPLEESVGRSEETQHFDNDPQWILEFRWAN